MPYIPIITAVELAIVDRLTRGLGKMVSEVKTYGGEFDDDELDEVVRRFPAAWVTFGGIKRTESMDTSREKWLAEAVFVVMVGARNLRNEEASRHGGPNRSEVGTNLLVSAVRKLLTMQDMGLPIRELRPSAVRTLFNTRVRADAMSVFACEFRTAWREESLFLGAYPQGAATDPNGLGAVFEEYGGAVDPPTPDWKTTVLKYFVQPKDSGTQGEPDAEDIV